MFLCQWMWWNSSVSSRLSVDCVCVCWLCTQVCVCVCDGVRTSVSCIRVYPHGSLSFQSRFIFMRKRKLDWKDSEERDSTCLSIPGSHFTFSLSFLFVFPCGSFRLDSNGFWWRRCMKTEQRHDERKLALVPLLFSFSKASQCLPLSSSSLSFPWGSCISSDVFPLIISRC